MNFTDNDMVTTAAGITLVGKQKPSEFVAAAQHSIEREKLVIVTEAKKLANDFFEHSELRANGFRTFWVYVRRKDASFEIVWVRNVIHTNSSGTAVLQERIPKGRKFSYPQKAFKGPWDYETTEVLLVEEKFALLRQRWSILTGLTRDLRQYRKRSSDSTKSPA